MLLNSDGDVVTTNGTSVVRSHGANGFPFTANRLSECERENVERYTKLIEEMGNFSFLPSGVEKVVAASEVVAFAFVKGEESREVLRNLVDSQERLEQGKLSTVIVPLDETNDFAGVLGDKLGNIPLIEFGNESEEIVRKFEQVVSGIEAPHVVVVSGADQSILKVLSEDASEHISEHGPTAFPWTTDAVEAKIIDDELFREEIISKQKNFEFLEPSGRCHVVGKNGVEVGRKHFQSNEVVGIYFSAQWCDSCRSFTEELKQIYDQCKSEEKRFEILFVSYSEESRERFEEYSAEMPWYALSYNDRELAACLGDLFNVYGIPTLVLLRGDGELITEDGISALQYGVEYFPWDDAHLEMAEADREDVKMKKYLSAVKEEEEVYRLQEEDKKIIIRRLIGKPSDLIISPDHVIQFGSFSTVGAPSVMVKQGMKAWYEVTFLGELSQQQHKGFSQIGWATRELPVSNHDSNCGVGDDAYSYGFDGQRVRSYRERVGRPWGTKMDPCDNRVLGVAINLVAGEVLYGLDGVWSAPMGVAFVDIDMDAGYFPALTGQHVTICVNFGHKEMKFGPPDDSFRKIVDVVHSGYE